MIKKITRKVMREVEETASSVGICDICGKEFNYVPWLDGQKRARYYHIRTGHYDWGNDSCESVESRDACCDECLSRFTQEWLKDEDVIRSNTAYIEIHKDRHFLEETDNDGVIVHIEMPQVEWIPIKTRPMNDEEKKKANEYFGVPYEALEWPDAWHYDCRLPEVKDDKCVDVLVTTKQGYVVATSYSKDCFGSASFENIENPDDISAWAYMPKPYKKEGESDADS